MEFVSAVELLRQLKREYDKNNVSALVGAGFSKNAISTFPLWTDLLLPIVKDILRNEFEALMSNINSPKSITLSDLNSQDREKEVCAELLLRHGNLEVVSEYIRRKGMGHESIDAHIEKYIKKAERDDDGEGWICDGISYPKAALETHNALLQCSKFRNIYTTNYDNLLEIAQDLSDTTDKLRVVTSESRLYDTAYNRAIIKLHGDITKSAEEDYEFDGDKNLKYIIAKEDYDSYLSKHQGFSYLMRLAMLQGRFCLIGFSGTDPNYMVWLQWMKDVMDKALEDERKNVSEGDKNAADSRVEKRVYLITATKYIPDEATELFYKNHHVGVIDLTQEDIQDELSGAKGRTEKGENKRTYIKSPSELLKMFFRYMQSGEEAEEAPSMPAIKQNSDTESYTMLWRKAVEALSKHLDLRPILRKIEKQDDTSVTPLYIGWQESIITSFLNYYSVSDNPDYFRLFALAVRDTGTMPSYYSSVLSAAEYGNGDAEWGKLKLREAVLSAPADDSQIQNEGAALDKIMYYAFRFEFQRMYEAIQAWKPAMDAQPQAWMLLSLFQGRDGNLDQWDRYIASLPDGKHRINACSMRNIQARDYPPKYDLTQAIQNGAVTVTTKIKEASQQINRVERNTSAYGTITHTISHSQGNPPYERSIRLLNLLYDNAYVPMYYSQMVIKEEDWYDVFSQLYETYPYPTIYYSAYILKSSLLRKMGQDMAYSKEIWPISETLLSQMLKAIGGEYWPHGAINGFLAFTGELYASVRPNIWTGLFIRNIFNPLLGRWNSSLSMIDGMLQNVSQALRYIADAHMVNYFFVELLNHIEETPDIINSLCAHSLRIYNLQTDDYDVQQKIKEITARGTLQTYGNIYYLLAYYGKLSPTQKEEIGVKIMNEDLAFAAEDNDSIELLAQLAQNGQQREKIKELVLRHKNIWNCGVRDKQITIPSFLNLSSFPETWNWSNEELKHIVANMTENIAAVLKVKSTHDDWFFRDYLRWITKMIYFAHRYGYWETEKGRELTELMQSLMNRLHIDEPTDILLLSNNYYILRFGIDKLIMALKEESDTENAIMQYNQEISILLTRAMMLDGAQFQTIVSSLDYLTQNYPAQIIARYSDKLLYILQISQNLDYKKLDIDLANTQNTLYHIAKVMSEHGVDDSIIRIWLTDRLLTRFNRPFDE